jgi:hypothetical protein
MLGKIREFWFQYRLRVSQDNLEYYRFWLQRLDGANGPTSSPDVTKALV